jgi:ATP-dependent Clp protease, protease subunit
MTKPWKFKAAGRGALSIELLEQIGDDFFGEGTTAASFSEELEAAGSGITEITLRISSPGGNVWDGLAIYDQLLRHPAKVTAHVLFAASIASVIAMSARTISIAPTGVLMIHLPSTVVAGTAPDFRKMADTLDVVADSMLVAYRRHSKKTKADLLAAMTAETWYNADEAVRAGLADQVSDPDEDEGEELDMAAILRAPIAAKFQHMPAQIAARVRAPRPEAPASNERERLRLRTELLWRLPDERQ